ncbi:MAG: gliding motility-associated ABC transporter ATP-binding subunit GldA [Cyclobacteriaceae bacterium]
MSIEINSLSKRFGHQKVLTDVCFQAKKGQILGFLGPNGAGKSTTMKIATGYLSPDAGDVLVNGISVNRHPKAISKLIGYLPEHNPLYPDLYIPEFLTFMGGLYQLRGTQLKERVKTVMEQCGLMPEKTKKIGQLSKGFRQRVGLAKSLVHDPEIIILDEPTSGLDPNQLLEIRKLIKSIGQDKTLIISTHIMQEVEAVCEKTVIIHKGKIVANELLHKLKSAHGEFTLLLQTEENLDPGWFEGLGFLNCEVKNTRSLLFTCTDPTGLKKSLMKQVQERNLSLSNLSQKENSLETIFYRLTKN